MTDPSSSARLGSVATRVVLASASPGRLAVLRAAGINPEVVVSGFDEDGLLNRHRDHPPVEIVAALAAAKADAVAAQMIARPSGAPDTVVIGCDSMLLLDGRLQGKPHTPDQSLQRWNAQAGRIGELLTGHTVLLISAGVIVARSHGTAVTAVHFATPTERELAAYIASGEPLEVAGAFTIDGLGGWFVNRIEGDPSCVVGLSLPTVRRLLAEIGVAVTDLWRIPPRLEATYAGPEVAPAPAEVAPAPAEVAPAPAEEAPTPAEVARC